MNEEQLRNKLFGQQKEDKELNECPGCGNKFRRFLGEACTLTCFYRNVL